MNTTQLMLIDISGLAHATFHVSGSEPDPNFISTKLIERVRAIASQHPHAAICCDSGKSFRHEIDPTYKAGRDPENRAVIGHQLGMALDVLRKDGFPVWAAKGFEADDLIASATAEVLKMDPDITVVVVSDDKDLSQLISDRVTQRKFDGALRTPVDVFDKFGVRPDQMGDFLALCGDKSDNIKGAERIGKTIAAQLLSAHGTLERLFAEMDKGVVPGVTPLMRTNLLEFRKRYPTVRDLIRLRTDAPVNVAEIATERTAAPMETDDFVGEQSMAAFMEEDNREKASLLSRSEAAAHGNGDERVPFEKGNDANDAPLPFGRELNQNEALSAMNQATAKVAERIAVADSAQPVKLTPQGRIVSEQPAAIQQYQPVDFSQQLEPRSMDDAVKLSQRAFESRLFGAFGTPQAVLMAVLAGRELGLSAMASLRAIYVIEGKPTLSADTMRAVVLKSGLAEYFRCTETTSERATFETKRKGEPTSISMTFTMAEAQTAGVVKKGSGWEKYPGDMLRARASAKLCRLTYPDVISGLYDPSEL